MTQFHEGAAPYAPPSAVLSVIDRYRDRGLTTPFDPEVMVKAGVAESLANRTLQSLKMLGLVDDAGNPAEQLRDLAAARGDEYPERLASIIRDKYAGIFAFVDPATDSMEQIQEAFRGFEPRGQRSRMVTLFLGLCQAANLAPETPKRGPGPSVPRPVQRAPRIARAAPPRARASAPKRQAAESDALPPALQGLLDSLPSPNDGWTAEDRDRFIKTFGAVLDFVYPIRVAVDVERVGFIHNAEAGVDAP